jgi:hypothetical protein
MSCKISIICEDHTLDQYICKPVIKAAATEVGKPNAQVRVVTSPRLTGFDSLKGQACALLERWATISDVVVFVVDLDCDDGVVHARNKIEALMNAIASCEGKRKAVVVFAQQEVEVWALWGSRANLPISWLEVLAECDPKELLFEPMLTSADLKKPDQGRTRLIQQSLALGWTSISNGCNELTQLVGDLRNVIE